MTANPNRSDARTILTVCTANICRSPSAATLLQRALLPLLPEVGLVSAGTAAVPGRSACDLSAALVGQFIATAYPKPPAPGDVPPHRSQRVSAALIDRAHLILALDRSHRAALAQLSPGSRGRTFTLRQAAAAAQVIAASLADGALPDGAPPIPATAAERFDWWVAELDAHRAFVAPPPQVDPNGGFDPLDVPDPHVIGYQYHPMAVELIESAVGALAGSLTAVLGYGEPAAHP